MSRYNFTLRLHNRESLGSHEDIRRLTVSNVTLITKPDKFSEICTHKGNQRKLKYSMDIKGKFSRVAGSNRYPELHFKGDYIDIEIKNFPYEPILEGYEYRKVEIVNIVKHEENNSITNRG